MKKLLSILFCLLPLSLFASLSVQTDNTSIHVIAPPNFWAYEAGLYPGSVIDTQFQLAVQAVQSGSGGGGTATNAFFISTPTVDWTQIGPNTNSFSVHPGVFDTNGAAANAVFNYSNYIFVTYLPLIQSPWKWSFTPAVSPTYTMFSDNPGNAAYQLYALGTNRVTAQWTFDYASGLLFSMFGFSGSGLYVTNIQGTNIVGVIPSNNIPVNLTLNTLVITNPSTALAVGMLGVTANGTVVTNPVPAGSVAPQFYNGTNTVFDVLNGSNRFNVPFYILTGLTNGYPWNVYNQPATPILTNLSSFNAQSSGAVLTNMQVIEYATVQTTNAGASKFVFTLAANGNTNAILILNTNFTTSASATNVLNGASLPGTSWTLSTDSINDLIISNYGPGNASYIFGTNGQYIVGLSGGATIHLGILTNNIPSFSVGNGSWQSTSNGQYYYTSNGVTREAFMP